MQIRQKQKDSQLTQRRQRGGSVTFKPEAEVVPAVPVIYDDDNEDDDEDEVEESEVQAVEHTDVDGPHRVGWAARFTDGVRIAFQRREALLLVFLWLLYLVWLTGWVGSEWH